MFSNSKYASYTSAQLREDIEFRTYEQRHTSLSGLRGINTDSDAPLVAFHLRLLYTGNEVVRPIADVEHDPRPFHNGYDMFTRGIVLQFFKNGRLRDERRYCRPERLEGLTNDECLSVAQRTVNQHVGDIIDRAEV